MEAYLLKDQSLSPYKPQNQIKNPRKYNHPLISHPSENFAPLNSLGGLLCAPPPPSHSFSFRPSVSLLPPQYCHRQQPPLLPLPMPIPQNYNPSRARGLTCPPVNRKIKNRKTRDQSGIPRKSKPNAKTMNSVIVVESPIAGRLGPEPKDLPKDVSRVLLSNNTNEVVVNNQVDKFSGSSIVFTDISPPPSSLPLPTFSLRPKLSCNVEAAVGIDAGATDSLRRLLRLR